mmetsp:Transcript_18224/g.42204  ORF Transcript_18224/g.42204 Transcript_18224/m.42204 type:complete len:89 (+) Transcript_18224:1026-1292(+)
MLGDTGEIQNWIIWGDESNVTGGENSLGYTRRCHFAERRGRDVAGILNNVDSRLGTEQVLTSSTCQRGVAREVGLHSFFVFVCIYKLG